MFCAAAYTCSKFQTLIALVHLYRVPRYKNAYRQRKLHKASRHKIKLQFRIGDINYIFTADVDSKLPQFSSQSAILEYGDERQLTSTREIAAQLNDGEFDVAFTNGVKAAGTLTHPVTTLTFAGEGNWNVE